MIMVKPVDFISSYREYTN